MLEDLDLFVTQFVTLYAMLEPIEHLSLFLALTAGRSERERRTLAVLCLGFAFGILIFFAVLGQALLNAMGISVLSFQIAGGLILFCFSLNMLFSETTHAESIDTGESLSALAVYPLATPGIAGPGAMLAVVILSDNNRHSYIAQALTLVAIAVMMLILLIAFWGGAFIMRIIGPNGSNLIRRVMAIITAAFSVDVVLTALREWLNLPPI